MWWSKGCVMVCAEWLLGIHNLSTKRYTGGLRPLFRLQGVLTINWLQESATENGSFQDISFISVEWQHKLGSVTNMSGRGGCPHRASATHPPWKSLSNHFQGGWEGSITNMDGGAIQYSRNKDRLKIFSFDKYPSIPILWHYMFVFVCVCACAHMRLSVTGCVRSP